MLMVGLLAVGMTIAPAQAVAYSLIASHSPPQSRTEAFTWLQTMAGVGGAAGAAVATPIIDSAGLPTAGFALAAVLLFAAMALSSPTAIRQPDLATPSEVAEKLTADRKP
jgi:MFS family permease